MAFKMKGSPFQKNGKKDPYTKEDYDFLKEQREEKVTSMDYLFLHILEKINSM